MQTRSRLLALPLLFLCSLNLLAADNFEIPLAFEPAAADSRVEFTARAFGYHVALDHGAVLLQRDGVGLLRMSLANAQPVQGQPLDQIASTLHYLRGRNPERWRTNVPLFERIRYSQVLPGVDLVYYGNQRRLEYDLVIAPGHDPNDLVLHFEGASRVTADSEGFLIVEMGELLPLILRPPRASQETTGVAARYMVDGNAVRFALGPYDHTRELVIDPVIEWTSYVSGNEYDTINGMALSPNGELVVAGMTRSASWTHAPTRVLGNRQNADGFVSRFSSQGIHLSTTFVGGEGGDLANGIEVDRFGNIYLVGTTNSWDFPTTSNAYQKQQPALSVLGVLGEILRGIFCDTLCEPQPSQPGTGEFMRGHEAFIMKFSPTADSALYSSYFGGAPSFSGVDLPGLKIPFMLYPGDDWGNDIAVDRAGRMHITGWTYSEFFPSTDGSEYLRLAGTFAFADTFLAIIDPRQSGEESLDFAGVTGGTNEDRGHAIANDGWDDYLTGETLSLLGNFLDIAIKFPTSDGALNPNPLGGGSDAFLVNGSARFVAFSTFLGGSGNDSGRAIAVEPKVSFTADPRNVYVGVNNQILKIGGGGKPEHWRAQVGGDVNDLKLREFPSDTARLFGVWKVSNSEFAVVHLDINSGIQTEVTRVAVTSPAMATEIDADFRRLYVAGTAGRDNILDPLSASPVGDGFITAISYNPFPTLTGLAPTANEGSATIFNLVSLTGFTSLHLPYSATINWGDGTNSDGVITFSASGGVVSGAHTYRDNGSYPVRVCLTERGDPQARCLSNTVVVHNVRPTVNASAVNPSTLGVTYRGLSTTENLIEVAITSVGTFSDPGISDTHKAWVQWGDGGETPVEVDENQHKVLHASHVYTTDGVKSASLCMDDKDDPTRVCTPFTIDVPNADLEVSRTNISEAEERECETSTYQITIRNNGLNTAHNVTLIDQIEPPQNENATYTNLPVLDSDGRPTSVVLLPGLEVLEADGNTAVFTTGNPDSTAFGRTFAYEFDRATLRWYFKNFFGSTITEAAVDIQGDTTVYSGRASSTAQIFRKAGLSWQQVAHLTNPSVECFVSLFGERVTVGGGWIAISNGATTCARIHLYRRSGNDWNHHRTFETASPPEKLVLSTDGDTLYAKHGGGIFIYRWDGASWQHPPSSFFPPFPAGSFTTDMEADDSRLIIAYMNQSANPAIHGTGRRLIYRDNVLEADFGPYTGGHAVAIQGMTAVAGGNDRLNFYSLGADGVWRETASTRPPEAPGGHDFGRAVSMSGQSILVGSNLGAFVLSTCLQTSAGRVECNLGTFPPNTSRTFNVSIKYGAKVAPATLGGGSARVLATSSVRGGAFDPALTSNSASLNPLVFNGFHASCDDRTPPEITPIVTGIVGDNGWFISDVSVKWKIADPDSVIQSTNGCGDSLVQSDTAGIEFTCTANSGGGTGSASVTIRRDLTPPTITAVAAAPIGFSQPGSAMKVAQEEQPLAKFICQDATSGVVNCPIDRFTVNFPIEPGQVLTQTIRDNAGHVATGTASAPIAHAEEALTAEVGTGCAGVFTLSGSGSDPAGRSVTFKWFAGNSEIAQTASTSLSRNIGGHSFRLRVTNSQGFWSEAFTTAEVVDRTPPVLSNVPADVTNLIQQTAEGVEYALPNPNVTDRCGAVLVNDAPSKFVVGTTPVTFTATDPSGNASIAITNVTVQPRIELAMILTAEEPAIAGRELRYRFKARNSGPSDATGVVVEPGLPFEPIIVNTGVDDPSKCTTNPSTGITTCEPFLSPSPDTFCFPVDGVLTCSIGPIAKNSERSFTMKVMVPSGRRGEIQSNGKTKGQEIDLMPANDLASLSTPIGTLSDRAVIFAPPAAVTAGSAADWTVGARNLGPSDANDVLTEVTLPLGIDFAGGPQNCIPVLAARKVRCSFGVLTPGASAQAHVSLFVDASHRGTITPVAMVTGIEPEPPNSGNDSVTLETLVIARTALSVTPSMGTPLTAGTDSILSVDVRNGGPSTSTSTNLTIVPTPGITLRDSPGCLSSGSQLVCGLGTFGVAETKRQNINISIDPYARGPLGNGSATARSTEAPMVSAAFSSNVNAQAELQLAFTSAPARGTAGERITYQFNALNGGPSGGTNIEVTSNLPSPLTFHSGDGCAATGAVVRCAIDRLDPQATRALSFMADINPIERGPFTTLISGTGTEPDPTAPNILSNTTQIDVSFDLSMALSAAPSPVTAGTDLTYQLNLSNINGPSTARDVVGKLTLPANAMAVPPADCVLQSGVVRCNAGAMAAQQSREFLIPVTIDGFTRDQVIGGGGVESADLASDRDPLNQSPSVNTPVVARVDLRLIKSDVPDPVTAGTKLRYDLGVTNLGPSGATAVTLSDPLPAGITLVSPPLPDPFPLARGATRDSSLEVRVGEFTRGILTNTASVSSAEEETQPVDNNTTELTSVIASSDLAITMTDAPDPIPAGNILSYRIEATNGGPSGGTNVRARTTLPAGVLFSSMTASVGSCTRSAAEITCSFGDLAVGASANAVIKVIPQTAGTIRARVEVSGTEPDAMATNNSALAETKVSSQSGGPGGTGDFDDDGDLDLVVVDENRDQVVFFLNDGTGRFTEAQRVNVGHRPVSLAIGDLVGDGRLDVAATNSVSNDVSILRNDGGVFAEASRPSITGKRPVSIAVGDVNGDGKLDLATANELSSDVSVLKNATPIIETELVALNLQSVNPSPTRHPVSIAMGDLDADEDLDLVVTHGVSDSISILSNAAGLFAETSVISLPSGMNPGSTAHHPSAIVVGSLSGDDRIDVAVANRVSHSAFVLTNGAGLLTVGPQLTVGQEPVAMTAADFDGGGTLDLATANRIDDSISILANGASGFVTSTRSGGTKPFAIVAGDFNGDGKLDLVSVEASITPFFVAGPLP